MLNEEQIKENWELFLKNLGESSIEQERKDVLADFYLKNEERFAMMPASGKTSYHSCFPGGYIYHVNSVFKLVHKIAVVWKSSGAKIDFTPAELHFVTLNHDLGKFGDKNHEYYINNTSDWHVKNRGELYIHNPALPFMKTPDRTLLLLSELGISVNETEMLAIKLHDGLYDEANKSYLVSFSEEYRLRSNLPYILHQADLASSRIEYDIFHGNEKNKKLPLEKLPKPKVEDQGTKNYVDKQQTLTIENDEKPKRKVHGKFSNLLNNL